MRSHIVPIQPELILAFENEKKKFTLFTFIFYPAVQNNAVLKRWFHVKQRFKSFLKAGY